MTLKKCFRDFVSFASNWKNETCCSFSFWKYHYPSCGEGIAWLTCQYSQKAISVKEDSNSYFCGVFARPTKNRTRSPPFAKPIILLLLVCWLFCSRWCEIISRSYENRSVLKWWLYHFFFFFTVECFRVESGFLHWRIDLHRWSHILLCFCFWQQANLGGWLLRAERNWWRWRRSR